MNMHTRLDSLAPGAGDAQPVPSGGQTEPRLADRRAQKWAALQEAARALRTLSGTGATAPHGELRDLAGIALRADPWRQKLLDEAIEDLSAVMEAGLAALLALHARGGNAAAAALALCEEFDAAEAAVRALVPAEQGAAD